MKYFIILTFFLGSMPVIAGELLENHSLLEHPSFDAFPEWGRTQPVTINSNLIKGSTDHIDFPLFITLGHLNAEVVDSGAADQIFRVNGTPNVGTTIYLRKSWKGNDTMDYRELSDGGIVLSGNSSISLWKKNTSTATSFGHSLNLSNSTGWISMTGNSGGSGKVSNTFFFYAHNQPTCANKELFLFANNQITF